MSESSELSERELEVLRLIATGASNKQIAQDLSISQNTVKVHIRNIFSKTGASSRTEAAIYAVQSGLVDPAGVPLPESRAPGSSGFLESWDARPTWQKLALVGITILGVVLILGLAVWLTRNILNPAGAGPTPELVVANVDRWQERAPLPVGRTGLALVAHDSRIFAISGRGKNGVVAEVDRYDPATNIWETLSAKPIPVTGASGVSIGGRIYVPGGMLESGMVTDVLEIYNPGQDEWETGASLPLVTTGYAAVALEGRLYLFGGWDGENFQDSVLRYDPDSDEWEMLPAMPTPRAFGGAADSSGRIYILGGENAGGSLTVVEEFTPAAEIDGSDPWRRLDPMPFSRSRFGLATMAGIIHIVGGEGDGESPPPVKFFPQDGRWEEFEQIGPQYWVGLGAVPLETYIHAVGGTVEGQESGAHLIYEAIYTISFPIFR